MKTKIEAILKLVLQCLPRLLLIVFEVWGIRYTALLVFSEIKSIEWVCTNRAILYFVSAVIVIAINIVAGFIEGNISIKVKVDKPDETE